MRLIDADALQAFFNEVSTSLLGKAELHKDVEHMVRAFLMTTEMIQDAQMVDAAPVVHARLVEDEQTYPGPGLANYKCTACGTFNGSWRKGLTEKELTNYCWNCGAKFDG